MARAIMAALLLVAGAAPAWAGDREECPSPMFDEGKLLGNIDPAKAVTACQRLADQGNAVAEYNLGVLYNIGKGVTPDRAEAAKWLRKAADQGLAKAQAGLGRSLHCARRQVVEAAR